MTWALVIIVGLFAGTLGGVIGFGSTTILMPLLVVFFGPKAAVPIMAVAAVLGNFARILVWWREIAWPAVAAFALPAILAAWAGVHTMLALNARLLEFGLGAFFITMVPIRRWLAARGFTVSLTGLSLAGTGVGFLTGIVANTGPINTPFFLGHGLVKGAFIGTEAMASLAMFTSKVSAFWAISALPWQTFVNGLVVGATLMIGARLAKSLVTRLDIARFNGLMDALLIIAGIAMMVSAAAG